ncbi:MAG TPA: lipid-A-disaccharide synthase N-terminal domain-containing protein [Thermoanaerobaculia bacterium]|nr:lipid-A-disaccharide synthase N-terminal domain-containing protein [Thermoanaerobaculia bacterium]
MLGQLLFSGRFLVQWVASERRKTSIVPRSFWYLSIAGGATLLGYALYKRDPVFILGQSAGLLIYARNLWFTYRPGEKAARGGESGAGGDATGTPFGH